MQRSPYFNDEYTVEWISGSSEELVVAMAMLDDAHGIPQTVPEEDTNSYHLGSIGDHKLVITCLPAGHTGMAPSVIAAENMRRTFTNLKVTLSVSTGGGVPGAKKDIRLGDVVVSYPNGIYPGVVQFDYGKLKGGGQIERKEWFCAPSRKFLGAIDILRAYHSRPENPVNNMLAIIEGLGTAYQYPAEGDATDLLYRADFEHASSDELCDECEKEALVFRKPRQFPSKPKVHYGNIASGSMTIMCGVGRDKINRRYDDSVLCLNTQAAGVSYSLPCIAIRGISDYSDSHANDQWRKPAIAVASAYAKELLSLMEPYKLNIQLPVEPWLLLNRGQNFAKYDTPQSKKAWMWAFTKES